MPRIKNHHTMRQFLLILAIATPFFLRAQTILYPDAVWSDGNRTWSDRDLATAIYNFQGTLYVFNIEKVNNYMRFFPNFYTMNKNHNNAALSPFTLGSTGKNYIDNFGYPHESELGSYPDFLGRIFAFEYNGNLWYYQNIQRATDCQSPCDECYECYARIPMSPAQAVQKYYIDDTKLPDVYKYGAFQFDSNMYFLGYNRNSKSTNYGKWTIQEYSYNTSTQQFVFVKDQYVSTMSGTTVGGIVRRMDNNGNQYIVVNTYTVGTTGSTGLFTLIPVINDNKREFTVSTFSTGAFTNVVASTIVEGSTQGTKTSDPYPAIPDRLTLAAINNQADGDGNHHIEILQFKIDGTSIDLAYQGEISPPSSSYPCKPGSYYQILGTYELEPHQYTNDLTGYDSYKQYVWFFYPDHNKHFFGIKMNSDTWRPTAEPAVSNNNLDDEKLYPGVSSLWSLVGICDGGPPLTVDWETWDSQHLPGTDPTETVFTIESENESKVTNTYEDQWTIGAGIDVEAGAKALKGSLSEEFKYCTSFKNNVSHDTTVTRELSKTFALMESNQDSGVFVYAVPSIARIPYACFPWWDNTLIYPVPYTNQYLFKVLGIKLIDKNMPLDGNPFYITDPNAIDMSPWRQSARPGINNALGTHLSFSPIIEATWINNQVGDLFPYSISASSSDSYEQSMNYEATAGASLNVPEIFKLNVTGSYEVNYSTETEVATNYGTKIEVNLQNLSTMSLGPQIGNYDVSLYWFRKSFDSTWWYYNDLGGSKPFYLAYIITNASARIKLLSPGNNFETSGRELLFRWESERGEVTDYNLFIATSSPITENDIVFRKEMGSVTEFVLRDYVPEKGKTYYWAVRGNASGETIWSPIVSFHVSDPPEGTVSSNLHAQVFPNPCRSNQLHIFVNPTSPGPITIKLTSISGVTIAEKVTSNDDGSPFTISFPGLELPAGIYVAVIRTGDEQIVRKIVME